MKTEIDIKDDLYRHLLGSELMQEVTGELSKTQRPEASTLEDVIISVLASDTEGDTVDAILNVNVYVADYLRDGTQYQEASDRLRRLARLSYEALRLGIDPEDGYRFELSRQRILAVPSTNEHVINNRIIYQSLK